MFRRCVPILAPTLDDLHAAFRVLGAPSGAPHDVVRSKYLELARRHHPDLSSGDDTTMKVINTAYELVQTHGSMLASRPGASSVSSGASPTEGTSGTDFRHGRFKKRVPRRSKVLADLGDGDAWATKTDLDWNVAMRDIQDQDLRNPANHPYSFSKHYSFEDDATIYRMVRTGATTAEVGRSIGKPATFIEKRLNNAQFKQRIQILLRKEKESRAAKQAVDLGHQATVPSPRKHWEDMSYEERQQHSGAYRREGGSDAQRSSDRAPTHWTAESVMGKVGRNYANFERFHNRGQRGGSGGGGSEKVLARW